MKKIVSLGLSTLLLAMMFSFSTPAKAETRYVYKWLQPYDLENGIDIKSTIYNDLSGNYEWHAVADDWQCRDERPVTDIHWWGSYWEKDANGGWVPYTGEEDPYWKMNTSPQFHLAIYADIPAGTDGINYSRPGKLLWSKPTAFTGYFVGHEQNPDMQNASKFRWDQILDEKDWFQDQLGEIYWISIYQEITDDTPYLWGWETSTIQWNDAAVIGDGIEYTPITPNNGMAFGLTTVPLPGSAWLLFCGVIGIIAFRRGRRMQEN